MEKDILRQAAIEALQSPEVLSAFSRILHSKNENSKPLSRKEASRYLQISEQTLDLWAKKGELKPIKFGRRVVYSIDDLEEFLNKKKC